MLQDQKLFFDALVHDILGHDNSSLLSHAVNPIQALLLDGRIPVRVQKVRATSSDQIQAKAARPQTHEKHLDTGVVVELGHRRLACLAAHGPIQLSKANAGVYQSMLHFGQHTRPLREYDRFNGRRVLAHADGDCPVLDDVVEHRRLGVVELRCSITSREGNQVTDERTELGAP